MDEAQQGYEDDFEAAEEAYLDDFEEAEDNDEQQEGPPSSSSPPPPAASHGQQEEECVSVVDTHAWPSLAHSTAVQPPAAPARQLQFARPLSLCDPAAAAQQEIPQGGGGLTSSSSAGATITEQPLPPPLSLPQRRRAAAALARARQLAAQHTLALSTQLELLVMPPLSLQEQFARRMGVYASRAVPAACQTRQLNRDIHEQDAQTDEVDVQAGSCQVPDDLLHTSTPGSSSSKQPGRQASRATGPEFASFVEWAAPQVLRELSRSTGSARGLTAAGLAFAPTQTAAAAAPLTGSRAGGPPPLLGGEMLLAAHSDLLAGRSVVGLCGPATPSDALAAAAAIARGTGAAPNSHLLLTCCSPVALPADAALKTHGLPALGCACVWALAAEPASRAPRLLQLLVSEGAPTCCCWGVGDACGLVFAGLEDGSVCCWDLAEPESMHPQVAPITDGHHGTQQPSQQPQRQGSGGLAARRPSYTAGVPTQLFAGLQGSSADASAGWLDGVDSVAAVAALPLSASGTFAGGGAVACGGPVCQLLAAASNGCLSLFTVLRGPAGSDAAVSDLGMRTGSRVWMVRMIEGLALGHDLAKPLHLRLRQPSVGNCASSTSAAAATSASSSSLLQPPQVSSLLVLPGPGKQLLVGVAGGRILKASCLAATSPPYELVAQQWQWPTTGSRWRSPTDAAADIAAVTDTNSGAPADALGPGALLLGAVLSLSVSSAVPDACLAALACGKVALFSCARSRPVLVWHHPLGQPVLAVRWLPSQPGAFVALCAGGAADTAGCLLAFDLARSTKAPLASAALARNAAQPRCLEVLATSHGSSWVPVGTQQSPAGGAGSKQQGTTALGVGVAVGFDDGSSSVFQLAPGWAEGPVQGGGSRCATTHAEQVKTLQELLLQ